MLFSLKNDTYFSTGFSLESVQTRKRVSANFRIEQLTPFKFCEFKLDLSTSHRKLDFNQSDKLLHKHKFKEIQHR